MTTDDDEYTALHLACGENASNKNINALIDIRGEELVMSTNDYGSTALYLACENNASIETINALIAYGGRQLVMSSSIGEESAFFFPLFFPSSQVVNILKMPKNSEKLVNFVSDFSFNQSVIFLL